MLFWTPTAVPVTLTEIVHEPPAVREPPVKLTLVAPGTAEKLPPQVLLTAGALLTASPLGKGSVNATPLNGAGFALLIVKLSAVVPPNDMLDVPKALLMV